VIFENSKALWLLLLIPPAFILFHGWDARTRQKLMSRFIQSRLLPGLVAGTSPARRRIRFGLLTAASACLVLALARPQWGFDWQEVNQRGLDIVVAIDTSKSMLAEDISPNRLARAKLAALDLIQQAKSDRLGLVAFAGNAFLQCPLTIDDVVFRQSVDALTVNTIPEGGTAIAEAIEEAGKAFKEGDNHRVLVLFTDGEDQYSDALPAAKKAAAAGLRIYTIGIGSAEGDLIRVTDAAGKTDYVRDEAGNVVKSRLNEGLLQEIAAAANGFYLPLRGGSIMETLYRDGLAPLPKTESKEKWIRHAHERYHWPLALGILLLLVEILFPERKRPTPPATGNALATVPVLLLLAGLLPQIGGASPASALEKYKAGDFQGSWQEYQSILPQHTNDVRLSFNAGTAAYRATNYDAAVKQFTAVLAARDVKLQQAAYHNLGNSKYRIGAAAESIDAVQENWEAAVRFFQSAVTLDKNDADARFNLEFVKRNIQILMDLREAARRAKAAADAATRNRSYHQALEIMESLFQNKNPNAKPLQEFTKKLKDIDAITTPPQH
jgi:Ca-activated chloride channel family protein